MKKKKWMIGGAAAGVVLVAAVVGFIFLDGNSGESSKDGENLVYVDSVATITGLGSGNGMINRFSGVVEPQETLEIKLPSEKTVKEVYVKEGDEVKKGQKLFIYDTTDAEEELSTKEIEVERIKMDIETYKANVESLKKDKANAGSEEQLDYTVRIQSAENNAKRSEYELKSTQQEIEQLKKSVEDAVVISEIDGMVKKISETGEDSGDAYYDSESESFMTILSTGKYRIKGSINEQNISSLMEGDAMLVHSRVNEEKTWKGTLTLIDMENPESGNDDMYYAMSSSSADMTSSSNYPFYVELETDDELMLGQHVYLERDYGQGEEKEGLWLPAYYIVEESYVWAADKHDKIEKRKVTLGEYDEELDEYQITDGLTTDDYIAYPEEVIEEGTPVTRNVDDLFDGALDLDDADYSMFDDADYSIMEDDTDEGYVGIDDEDFEMESDFYDEEYDEEDYEYEEDMDIPSDVYEVGDEPMGMVIE